MFKRLCAAVLPILMCASVFAANSAPLPAERLTVNTLPRASPHWIYVLDEAYDNQIDTRIWVFDGDSHRRLGQLDTGFMPNINLSPDRHTMAVATTYFARGGHGTRTDVVEFNDNQTLAKTGEIVLPPKHAETLATQLGLAYSSDGHFLYSAYITPAASFGVLDPINKKVLNEIDTAGCVLVMPAGPNRVSSICESGKLLTVTLDASGHESARSMSETFFNADTDPIFVQGIPTPKGYVFLSFLGAVHEVDLSGSQPAFSAPWSLTSEAERGAWRPGGVQIGTLSRSLGRLFVSMHKGGEGSHKEGGTEIWEYDLAKHERRARWPINVSELGSVQGIQVSQDEAPLLFATTDKASLAIFDARTGTLRHVEKNLGQTPQMLLTP